MAETPTPTGPQGGEALTGSGEGSDTRAGSPQGGSASGAEPDPAMADAVTPEAAGLPGGAAPQGQGASNDRSAPPPAEGRSFEAVTNVGASNLGPHGDPAEGKRGQPGTGGDDVDAATG